MSTKPNTSQITYDTGSNKQDLNNILDTVVPIADYTALRNYSGRATQVRITADGIAGFFKYDPTDTTSVDNSGTIIVAGSKRWKRVFDGVVSVKDFGAVGDGVTDDTAVIQSALIASIGKTLLFPSGTYRISFQPDGSPTFGMGLDVPSNITIQFEPGAQIKPLPYNHTIYQIFRCWNKTNVTFLSPIIDGNKAENSAVSGESGMGIDIRGGSNIAVINPTTNNCWGDGIYLDYFTLGDGLYSHPSNVYILNHRADGCRRQGVSVISADGLIIENPVWSNIAGILPEAGIDIEPNDNNSVLNGIRVINPKTINCAKGVYIYLGTFAGVLNKTVDIEVSGHSDDGSTIACAVGGLDTSSGSYKVNGAVKIIDPLWVSAEGPAFTSFNWDVFGPVISVVRPVVVNPNRSSHTFQLYGAPFVVGRDAGDVKTYAVGNVIIENPSVTLTSGSIPKLFAFQDASVTLPTAATRVQNVFFKDPITLAGLTDAQKQGVFRGQGNISDAFNVWAFTIVGSNTLTDFNVAPILASNASTAQVLGSVTFSAGSPDVIFRNPFTTSFVVQTDTGGNFVGMTVGQRLQSFGADAPGSYLRIKPLGSNRYLILDRLGIWNTI